VTTFYLIATLLRGPGDDGAAEDAIERFRIDFRSPSAAARATAVAELSRTPHVKTLPFLSALLVAGSPEVRTAAAKGIAAYGDYRKPALAGLKSALRPNASHPEVQAEIYRSLGRLQDVSALRLLHSALNEKDPAVVKGALEGMGLIRSRHSVEPVMQLMRKCVKLANRADGGGPGLPGGSDPNKERAKVLLPATVRAMKAISGEPWPTPQEWEIWWARNRATFRSDE
jgi:HEAT repeat protein